MKKIMLLILLMSMSLMYCYHQQHDVPISGAGVIKAEIPQINTNDGLSTEQKNIIERLKRDNDPASIKWIYGFSSLGNVIFRSTAKGKITSSGKRLEPTSSLGTRYENSVVGATKIKTADNDYYYTNEVIQADGTYGTSDNYVYWFDERDVYHQWTGTYLVTSEPLKLKDSVLNFRDVDNEELQYIKSIKK